MVVHYLRLSSRSARNVLRFHSRRFSSAPKRSGSIRWIPLVVGGVCVGGGTLEYLYPKTITAYLPFISTYLYPDPPQEEPEEKPFEAIDILYNKSQVTEDLDKSINKLRDIIKESETPQPSNEIQPDPTVEPTVSEAEAAPKKKKKKRKKKKMEEEVPAVAEPVQTEAEPVSVAAEPVPAAAEPELAEAEPVLVAAEPVLAEVEPVSVVADPVSAEAEPVSPEPEPVSAEAEATATEVAVENVIEPALETVAEAVEVVTEAIQEVLEIAEPSAIPESTEDLTTVTPFEIPVDLTPKEAPVEEAPVEEAPEFPADISVDAINSAIETALAEMTVTKPLEVVEEKPDEAELIIDALKSLDYEPVLSDTVLDLLVGKAANREKAVVATISRLENAMANVVNEVQTALEHHNKTSALVTLAKLNAQSISEATSKQAAKQLLEKLLQSSTDVRVAFSEGEEINGRVTSAFTKLSEIIEKAEQFDLKGPVDAARALLSKSRSDYYKSCETAQENQVDHALVSHYQRSVVNRKKVLDRELEILREHFPKQHHALNQTFESLEHHQARVDELNTLITYLSNKVDRLESDLETQQKSELEKLKTVAEAQKAEDAKILEERLKAQAEQLKYKYDLERQSEVESAVAAARDESARHAAKQAQILKQEMTEAAEKQIRDLNAFWSDEAALRESVVEVEYQCKLEKTNALLSGVNQMLDTQSERYQILLYNQTLLNLTTTLFDTINSSENIDAARLQASVDVLRSEYPTDPLVSAVTASIPHSVTCPSFTVLRDRLTDLNGECRKAALVTSEDCGIGSSILSRAMSALTFHDPTYDTAPEEGGSWTLYYLNKAEQEMRKNNLDSAARYLNQLVGKPRDIVTEWLKDARTLLEMRQSANVLLNYAKSKNSS